MCNTFKTALQGRRNHAPAGIFLADPNAEIFGQYAFRGVPAFVIVAPNGDTHAVTAGYTSEIGLRLRLWWATRTGT